MYNIKTINKIDNFIKLLFALFLAIIPYIFTVLNGTNFGSKVFSYDIWIFTLLILNIYAFCINGKLPYHKTARKMFNAFIFMIFIFFASSFHGLSVGFTVLLVLPVSSVFSFSYIGYNNRALKVVGYIYWLITFYILYDYTNGGFTQNWNSNVIGLISLYAIFWMFITNSINNNRNFFDRMLIVILIYFISVTNSRTVFLGIFLFIVFRLYPFTKIYKDRKIYRLYYSCVLITPIFLVNIYIFLWKSSFSYYLDKISYQYTGKLFFSGREVIWTYMYKLLEGHWLLGYGKELVGNSHSLFMSILYSVGIIGLLSYLLFLTRIYEYLFIYAKDKIVKSCILGFSSIYLMQTFEVIMFDSRRLDIIPYLFLATAIGRSFFINQKIN